MEPLKLESRIVLDNKQYEMSDVIKTLYSLPAEKVVSFFNDLSLNIPIRLRMDTIKEVLNDDVLKTREERDTLADELNYRLKLFHEFSDTQYVNLLSYYNLKENNTSFMELFWLRLVNYMIERGVSESHINELFASAQKHVKKNGVGFSDLKAYNDTLNILFYDEPEYLDGLAPKKIRPVLFQSSTLVEIREIGLKYGVDVPRRLRKKQLLDIIFDELEERNKLTDELQQTLSKKSVIAIQRFAIDNEIKVSTELKKEEIIEYILENAQQTKESYFKPETSEYHLEVDDRLLNQKVVEKKSKKKQIEVAPEAQVENVVESVKEEPKNVEEQTKPVQEDVKVVETKPQPVKEEPKNADVEPTPVETKAEPIKEEPKKVDVEPTPVETKAEPVKEEPKKLEVNKETTRKVPRQKVELTNALVINTIKYYDDKSFLKNYLTLDGTKKATKSKGDKTKDGRLPLELRLIGSLFMFIFCVLFRIIKFALIIATILLLIIFVYGSIVHFGNITALESVNETINSFEIFGSGILEHISNMYEAMFELLGL